MFAHSGNSYWRIFFVHFITNICSCQSMADVHNTILNRPSWRIPVGGTSPSPFERDNKGTDEPPLTVIIYLHNYLIKIRVCYCSSSVMPTIVYSSQRRRAARFLADVDLSAALSRRSSWQAAFIERHYRTPVSTGTLAAVGVDKGRHHTCMQIPWNQPRVRAEMVTGHSGAFEELLEY